jgi:hypothetical protein
MASSNQKQTSRYQEEAGSFLALMSEMAPQLGLDYSVDSLQRLDQFISEHFEPPGSKVVDENLVTQIGCYVGEVMIRQIGGSWAPEDKPEITGIGDMEAIRPLEKVRHRFENGRQDSLIWYYHAITKQAYESGVIQEITNMPGAIAPSGKNVRPATPTSGGGLFGFLKDIFGGK